MPPHRPEKASHRAPLGDGGSVLPAGAEELSHPPLGLDGGTVSPVDVRVAELASRQRGIVTTAQLLALGLTRHAIDSRVRRGWLHRRHQGIYAVGHLAEIPFAAETAALFVCGPQTVASDHSAAAVLKLLPAPELPHVTVPRARRARHEGIVIRRRDTLTRQDVWIREGLRITNPTRTLADLATTATPDELHQAINEAHALRLIAPGHMPITPNRPGAARLRAAARQTANGYTRSEAERRLRALVKRAGLPEPKTNVKVAGVRVDAVWERHGLVVEFDGAATHAHQLDRDHRNAARLRAAGYEVIRISWSMLTDTPELVLAQIALRLGARAAA
ncbi:MAG TPA: type IV toxin-antitoxin system AbiEi family antitoxin domain-containing protein [Solirubrobacteraceae bacterium]|nr:type IV toxin-antitoxin system AbiEi family antitoxin domain-containing protein [Solirubrobacteraceae bacterium]